jgi:hypothetical protein
LPENFLFLQDDSEIHRQFSSGIKVLFVGMQIFPSVTHFYDMPFETHPRP